MTQAHARMTRAHARMTQAHARMTQAHARMTQAHARMTQAHARTHADARATDARPRWGLVWAVLCGRVYKDSKQFSTIDRQDINSIMR
jgi:hypothetical protein